MKPKMKGYCSNVSARKTNRFGCGNIIRHSVKGIPVLHTTSQFLVLFLLVTLSHGNLFAQNSDEFLKNRKFTWNRKTLSNWTIEDGAGAGSIESKIRPADGALEGALELSGNNRTQRWKYVGQQFDAQPGDFLRLSYSARAFDVKMEQGQFNNCYIGLKFENGAGKNLGITFYPVVAEKFTSHIRIASVPDGAVKTTAMIFLSKTGKLQVKHISAKTVKAADSFDVLVEQMNRYYSYFDHKKIDWDALVAKYRPKATAAVKDQPKFEKVLIEMLAELKDGHVWLMRDGKRIPAWSKTNVSRNVDFRVVKTMLRDIKSFGQIGFIARTKDHNLGYICLTSLDTSIDKLKPMLQAIGGLYETDGMIVDLRANGGGSEDLGRVLAGVFCQKPVTYAINRFRKNNNHDEFVEYPRSPLTPIRGKIYDRPVVALIGAGAVSSAEGTALMFQALPNVSLVGQPTRGSSGNPAGGKLPNGTEVFFSRWVACNAKGQPIEDRGVQPDIVVKHREDDPTLKRAIKELAK